MNKYRAILTVSLAIFSQSMPALGQANVTSATPRGDVVLELDSPGKANKTESFAKVPSVSKEATAEAKRLYRLGVKYGRGGLFRQASELFEKAVQLNPHYADAHYGLGQAYFDQGRWEEATRSFQKAISINPNDMEARAKLDKASVLAGRKAKTEPQPKNDTPAVTASLDASTGSRPNKTDSSSTDRSDLTRVYRIGVGDVIDVRLGNEPAIQSTLFTVTPSGLLEHPILPTPLQVSGLTVDETRTKLEDDLRRRAVSENPSVSVGVREYLSHAIIVSGLVKDPGTKLLRREAIPLYVVVADAQPAPEAGRATLIRHETGEALVVDLSKPAEMNVLVRSGDVITVQESPRQFFYVGGEVKAPGEIQFRPGLTLTQAILAAGGSSREDRKSVV